MALEKTVTTPQGFEALAAYHRVENITLVAKDAISFVIRSYKQKNGVPSFEESQHTSEYDIAGNNPIAQAYVAAKKLPKFSDAKDC